MKSELEHSALTEAKRVIQIEAQAVKDLEKSLDHNFVKATEMILACKGRVVITGIGKSGHIARKMASTLSSTGTPSFFLHPAESSHGDLGMIAENDLVIGISYGGNSREFEDILKYINRKGISFIALTGNAESQLAKVAQCVLSVKVSQEACPLNLAPTASTVATLAMGDALAMAVLVARGFSSENFAEFHPRGALGFKLLTRVSDIMHSGQAFPVVSEGTPMKEVLSVMTQREVRGLAAVVNQSAGELIGVVTDGDIRRALEKKQDILNLKVDQVMSRSPKTIEAQELADKALFLMEQFKIQTLIVTEGSSIKPVGVINFQDLMKAKVR